MDVYPQVYPLSETLDDNLQDVMHNMWIDVQNNINDPKKTSERDKEAKQAILNDAIVCCSTLIVK